jgi:hypothetical protein
MKASILQVFEIYVIFTDMWFSFLNDGEDEGIPKLTMTSISLI